MAFPSSPAGYSVNPVNPDIKSLLCAECELVLRDAVQTEDGVRLCQVCYEKIARLPNSTSPSGICVLDEDNKKPTCYPDKAVQREVKHLKIYCNNKEYGCEWIGELAVYFDVHTNTCEYIPVECPNQPQGCTVKIPTARLLQHLESECDYRLVQCEHCRVEIMSKDLESHYEECSKYPKICPLCNETISNDKMRDHRRNTCAKIECVCDTVFERQGDGANSASKHLGISTSSAELLFHFISIITFTRTILDDMKQLQSRIVRLETRDQMNQPILPVPTDYVSQSELRSSLQEIRDSIVPARDPQLDWEKEKDRIDVSFQSFRTSLEEMDRKSKQQDAMISSLKTRLEQQTLAASWDTPSHMTSSRTGLDSSRAVLIEKKYEELERQVASVKVHVSELELQLQASLASTYNGALLWRIPDIHRRRRDAIDERITSIYSPPFYTGRNGYKMCIRAYLNGDGMGYKTHLSLFFVVMKGEYDALLKWPFEYKVSLILVDQTHRKHIVQTFKPTPESNSFQRPTTDMNTASGCPTFSKLTALEDPNYVKDDVIFIKCIVDTSKIFHP